MACSNTFLDSSSIHGGTAVLFTIGGFAVLKLRKSKKATNYSNILKGLITVPQAAQTHVAREGCNVIYIKINEMN